MPTAAYMLRVLLRASPELNPRQLRVSSSLKTEYRHGSPPHLRLLPSVANPPTRKPLACSAKGGRFQRPPRNRKPAVWSQGKALLR